MTATQSVWREPGFSAYLGSTGFSGMALAMQQLLLSWILIGILDLPADQVGVIQALIGIPGIVLMLMGGASADQKDARRLLVQIYLIAPILPLFLLLMEQWQWLNVATVTLWGLGMSVVQSYSMPGQQAILNRVSGNSVQQGITVATAIGYVVQVIGLGLAGQIDRLGVSPVLIMQALTLLMAGIMMLRIAPMPAGRSTGAAASPIQGIAEGLRATYRSPVIFDALLINFVSSIFNAGSFVTAFPFIVKRVYEGDAWMLAWLMAVFFAAAAVSNVLLLRYMPLKFPGKVFLIMQLSRIVVLLLMWIEPEMWLLVVATIGWGLNMGVTTTLARTIVQESAEAQYRGRVLSVFSIGMVGSAPIGAIILGWIIETFGTLNALVPAMFVSLLLFLYGAYFSKVWAYRSAAVS
ncbi:MAG: MFS transporter [Pseudomonadota bacterium]|nr:MFS transporter [Pseudomonadota bacterium]